MYTYQKTLLYACRSIKESIRECEKIIEFSAYNSKYSSESCLLIANRILEIVEEKTKLIKLKNLLGNIIKNFTPEEKKLFAYKYLGVKKTFEFSTRQYFRNQDKLLKNFASTLRVFGLTEEVFKREYLPIPYIKSIYSVVKSKDLSTEKRFKKRTIA
ncbi:MAG: hypothetical protein J6C97_03675 [Clostridia bacterium]|nr:hypothetical protein [Clostridia bacterium]